MFVPVIFPLSRADSDLTEKDNHIYGQVKVGEIYIYTGELGYDGLNGTRKIGPSYAKSGVYI